MPQNNTNLNQDRERERGREGEREGEGEREREGEREGERLKDLYINGMNCLIWICSIIALAQALHCVTQLYYPSNAELLKDVEKLADLLGVVYDERGKPRFFETVVETIVAASKVLKSRLFPLAGTPREQKKPLDMNAMKNHNHLIGVLKSKKDLKERSDKPEIQTLRRSIQLLPTIVSDNKYTYKFDKSCPIPPSPTRSKPTPTPTKYRNFDGLNTEEGGTALGFRVSKSTTRLVRRTATSPEILPRDGGGVMFQLENQVEWSVMVLDAVERTGPDNVICTPITRETTIPGGACINSRNSLYTLNLQLRHMNNTAYIRSDDTKLQTLLLGRPMQSQFPLARLMTGPYNLASFTLVRHYLKFSEAVKRQLFHLLELMNRNHAHPDTALLCFRTNCYGRGLITRPPPSDVTPVICSTCRIAEFCSQCGNNWHTGPCNATNEEREAFYRENEGLILKPCPNCMVDIDRVSGCNHITCGACKTHFCWLCVQILPLDRVSEHYDRYNAWGPCVNRLSPVEGEQV